MTVKAIFFWTLTESGFKKLQLKNLANCQKAHKSASQWKYNRPIFLGAVSRHANVPPANDINKTSRNI